MRNIKKTAFLLALLLCAALACGCGKNAETQTVDIAVEGANGRTPPSGASGMTPPDGMTPPSGAAGEGAGGKTGTGDRSGAGGKTGAGGAGATLAADPDAASTVFGRVESIVGNEATLLLGTVTDGAIAYGEEKETYLLPVGMAIGTGDFSTVSAGMTLRLSFNESGVITAVSVAAQ